MIKLTPTKYPSCDVAQGLGIDHDILCGLIETMLLYWEGTERESDSKKAFEEGRLETGQDSIFVYWIRIEAMKTLIEHLYLNLPECQTDEWLARAQAVLSALCLDQVFAALESVN